MKEIQDMIRDGFAEVDRALAGLVKADAVAAAAALTVFHLFREEVGKQDPKLAAELLPTVTEGVLLRRQAEGRTEWRKVDERTLAEIVRLSARASADPGAFTPRGDDYTEALGHWIQRAMAIALAPFVESDRSLQAAATTTGGAQ